MILVNAGTGTGLREIATGVILLPLERLDPVIIAVGPAGLDPDLDVALPLLTRRRQVFVADADVRTSELPGRFALLVAPVCETPLVADARVSALIVLGSAAPAPDVHCPVLVIAPAGLSTANPATADVRFAEAGHPAEQAYLIDAFLREPRRYPAHSTIPRARP